MAEFGFEPIDNGHAGGNGHFHAEPESTPQLSFACPSCQQAVFVDAVPENGLLKCPHCGGEFFATAVESDEDREEIQRLELEQRVREDRLVDLKRNKVLLERRSLYRTRTYFIIGMVLFISWAMQLTFYSARRAIIEGEGLSLRVCLYLAAIVVMIFFAYLCLRKILSINAELAEPVQHEPTAPPDFSTLSDGSQRLDEAARNLERLGGGPRA